MIFKESYYLNNNCFLSLIYLYNFKKIMIIQLIVFEDCLALCCLFHFQIALSPSQNCLIDLLFEFESAWLSSWSISSLGSSLVCSLYHYYFWITSLYFCSNSFEGLNSAFSPLIYNCFPSWMTCTSSPLSCCASCLLHFNYPPIFYLIRTLNNYFPLIFYLMNNFN